MSELDWIAADWGTSHLRVWGMKGTHAITNAQSDRGMVTLSPPQYEHALLELVHDWLPEGRTTLVVACGMLGSRQGWVEAPYRAVPCMPQGATLVQAPSSDPRLKVVVISGLKQTMPADVMRGEETQIAGHLTLNSGWDGVICLPGTHSKWVHISAGEVVSFQTFLTGEMFRMLADHSILRHGLAGWEEGGFAQGVAQGLERPERLLSRLFSLRAEGLLHALAPETARARLSGLLIGAEIAAAKPYWLGQRVAVLGDRMLADLYARALESLSVPVTRHDVTDATLAGLGAARAAYLKQEQPCGN